MSYTPSALLSFPIITTGSESGTWGDVIDNGLTSYLDIAIAGTLSLTSASFTANALTLANTAGTSSATNIAATTAQYMVLKVSSLAANVTITAPSTSKLYLVDNIDTTYTVTIKASGQTGYTVPVSTKAWVYFNGTDYVLASTNNLLKLTGAFTSGGVPYFSSTSAVASSAALAANAIVLGGGAGAAPATTTTGTGVVTAIGNNTNAASGLAVLNSSGYLAIAQGGTNSNATATAGGVGYGTGTAHAYTAAGTAGQVLQSNGASAPTWANASTGTVTSVSWTGGIVSVATGTTTPAFTIAGTSGGIPYFSSGTTWATSAALAANAIVVGGGAGAAPSTVTTGTGVLTALAVNVGSSGAFTTNNAANTFTALQTFSGSTSVAAAKLTNAKEVATVSATAATGTINYDVTTQSVLYYTTNASANWTVNFRASSGTSLDTMMSTGESVTVAFLVTQGATPYYNSAVQVDGNSVTPKWQGGAAPTSGNASGVDAYVYTIVKTGSAAFTIFASQTQFA